jgi:hypothetical protein
MSNVEETFSQFSWDSNSNWNQYFNSLDVTPSGAQLEKVKRRWFKKNIDSSLEIASAPQPENTSSQSNSNPESEGTHRRQTNDSSSHQKSEPAQPSESNNNQQNAGAQNTGESKPGFFSKIGNSIAGVFGGVFDKATAVLRPRMDQLYLVEGFLKIGFIFSSILLPDYANMLAFQACLMGFFRQCGRPYATAEYGKKALENEFLQNMFYMVPFVFFPGQKSLVYFMPLGIHFTIAIAELIKMKFDKFYQSTQKYVDFIRNNKYQLMMQKAKLEIFLFVFLVVFLFFGNSNLILLIFYGNFLKTKWMLNNSTKAAFSEIDYWITGKLNSRFCPGAVKFLVDKVRAFCAYMVKV